MVRLSNSKATCDLPRSRKTLSEGAVSSKTSSSQDELSSLSLQGLLHGGCRNDNLAVKCCSESNKTLTLRIKKHEIDTVLLGQEGGNTRRIMKWLHIVNFCEYSDTRRPLVYI